MSHFTVLVPAKSNEDLEAKLLPYHEYECTGIEAYTQFVPGDLEEMKTEYEEHKDSYTNFDQFAKEWYGYEKNEQGVYGRVTNPNAKWDWWSVGGRWTGLLQFKNHPDHLRNGSPGLMTDSNTDPMRGDFGLVSEIDWAGMRQEQFDKAIERYHTYHKVKAEISQVEIPVTLLEKLAGDYHADNEVGKNIQGRFPALGDFARNRILDRELWNHHIHIDSWFDHDRINLPESEYRRLNHAKALTFAFIDLEGRWNQRGEMGWFTIVTDRQPDYEAVFWRFIESLPDDQMIYVVDCHI